MPQFFSQLTRHQLFSLFLIVLFGFALRLYNLEEIYLWHDETDWFDEQIYDGNTVGWRRYAALKAQEHSVGPAWPMIVGLGSRLFGRDIAGSRMTSVLIGTAQIAAIFLLLYLAMRDSHHPPFLPAAIAACLTAISIVPLDFSQRLLPYVAVPFLSTLILLSHLAIHKQLKQDVIAIPAISILGLVYAVICSFSLAIHLSIVIVIGSSFLLLAYEFLASLKRLNPETRNTLIIICALVIVPIGITFLFSWLHLSPDQTSYRPYLNNYYHSSDIGVAKFIALQVYDLLTYNLNLFYNEELYWPRTLNLLLTPLVAVTLLGWVVAVYGSHGSSVKNLGVFAILCLILIVAMSIINKWPLGGVRQNLFITPFIYSFSAIGIYTLLHNKFGIAITTLAGIIYLFLWGFNLPGFYHDRTVAYHSQNVIHAWENTGRPAMYALGASKHAVKYRLGIDSGVQIDNLGGEIPETTPFLLVSTHWPIQDSLWRPSLSDDLRSLGYKVTLLMEKDAKYPVNPDYISSIYWPPNGLWLYLVDKEVNQTQVEVSAGKK